MANSVYISENLSTSQLDFIKFLDNQEIDIFTISEIRNMQGLNVKNLNEILENLVHKGLLSRIEKGKFCRHNFRDELVIGNYLVRDGAIAYWSALNKHGLTDQFPNTVFMQSPGLKANKTVFGVKYKFVKVKEEKIAGIQSMGYGNRRFQITNIEKTLIDCFDQPRYSGGYSELLKAFAFAKLSAGKMTEYCKVIGNIAAIKRMGFLTEFLGKQDMKSFVSYAREQVNRRYSPFDPSGTDKGEFIVEWKLRLNISKEKIKIICNNIS